MSPTWRRTSNCCLRPSEAVTRKFALRCRVAPDAELLEAWRGGDQAAGSQLVERHMQALYRFFRTKVDRDVDELIQTTWLACLEAKTKFRGDSAFRTYLFGIARNILLDHFRRQRRDGDRLDFGSVSAVALGTSPTQGLAKQREHQLLLHAMRSIALDHQIALELFYWEELTSNQLAEILGVPHNTMRTRINRARAALRERLEELATSKEVLDSTQANLDGWAQSLRSYLDHERQAR